MIGELATRHPITVLTTTRVEHAARLMAELGIGDVIVTDPDTGTVVGMLTDRDITVRLVANHLDALATEVKDICTSNITTITANEEVTKAEELMRRDAIRRLPVVDANNKPIGIVSIEDLAASGHVADKHLRDVLRALAAAYRQNRITGRKT